MNHPLPLTSKIRWPNSSPPESLRRSRHIRVERFADWQNQMGFVFHAYGHPAIRSTHPTTFEITTKEHLSRRGDCIIAVNASKGLADLPGEMKKALSSSGGTARMTLLVSSHRFTVEGRGAMGLSHSHPSDIVVRKSSFVSDRTLMVNADKAAVDIPRDMVQLLRDPAQRITVEISTLTASVQL